MKVNGQRIPDARFEQEWQRLSQARQQDPRLQQMSEDQLRQMTMENVIGQILLEQEATRRYTDLPGKDVKEELKAIMARYGGEDAFLRANHLKKDDLKQVEKDVRRRLAVNKLLDKLFADVTQPTEKEAFDEYMKQPADFGTPEQIHASHIVKHTNDGTDPKEAYAGIKEAKQRLDEGADFDKLAEELSDCSDGGQDLGFFPRGQMVQEFEDVVFEMEPDSISDIFKTDFGYHIAKVHEKKPATVRPFDEIKTELLEFMVRRRQNEKVEKLVSKLRNQAKIEN